MGTQPFAIEMDIDDDGFIAIRMRGQFELNAWKTQRRALLDTKLRGIDLTGRPSIVDLTDSEPPESDWASQFQMISQEIAKDNEGSGPRAIVTGGKDSHFYALQLFEAIEKAGAKDRVLIKIFKSLDEARVWLRTVTA